MRKGRLQTQEIQALGSGVSGREGRACRKGGKLHVCALPSMIHVWYLQDLIIISAQCACQKQPQIFYHSAIIILDLLHVHVHDIFSVQLHVVQCRLSFQLSKLYFVDKFNCLLT